MTFNWFTLVLLVRLLLLGITMALIGYQALNTPKLFTLALLLILLVVQFWFLLKLINRTNDELAAFLLSFQQRDATRSFDLHGLEKNFGSLHSSFNKMNDMLRETRRQKEEQEQVNQLVIDQVGTGLFTFQAEGKVPYHNKAAAAILGVEGFGRLEQLKTVSGQLPYFVSGLREGKPGLFKINQNSGKQVPVSFTKKRIFTSSQELFLVSMLPIGNEMDQQEVESWQKLIRILTHEIMNTITPVITLSANIERCLDTLSDLESIPEYLSRNVDDAAHSANLITSRGESLMHFVENYRSLSLLPKPNPVEVPMKEFLEKQLGFFSIILKQRNISSRIVINPPGLTCMIDAQLLSQVMVNLIKNSLEALDKTAEPAIEIIAGSATGQVVVTVKDNGQGIAPEHLDNVFVPFFTTRKNGSGVGLSLCRQVMALHNGQVELNSEPGKGCSISLIF